MIREAGKVQAWDGERGRIRRQFLTRGQGLVLTFSAEDVIEGTPRIGQHCAFTPGRNGTALRVRTKK